MLRLWEVVSVVNQFSSMSKVNTLCNIQVCKCSHYNTSFSLATYRACLLPESDCGLPALGPLGARHPRLPQPALLRAMTIQRYFTLGAGFAFCGSVNSGQSSNAMSFRLCQPLTPLLSLHFLWYQQTVWWSTIESTGETLNASDLHHLSEGPWSPC